MTRIMQLPKSRLQCRQSTAKRQNSGERGKSPLGFPRADIAFQCAPGGLPDHRGRGVPRLPSQRRRDCGAFCYILTIVFIGSSGIEAAKSSALIPSSRPSGVEGGTRHGGQELSSAVAHLHCARVRLPFCVGEAHCEGLVRYRRRVKERRR